MSNVYGEIVDVAAMCAAVKELAPNARTVVDGVAYAPHRCVDVAAFGCDWYVMSNYKVPIELRTWRGRWEGRDRAATIARVIIGNRASDGQRHVTRRSFYPLFFCGRPLALTWRRCGAARRSC